RPSGVATQPLRRLGPASVSPQLLDLLRWGRTLSVNKAARDLGFKARLDTPPALEEFYRDRRIVRFRPDFRAYMDEKELEDFIHSRAPEPSLKGQPRERARRGRRRARGEKKVA